MKHDYMHGQHETGSELKQAFSWNDPPIHFGAHFRKCVGNVTHACLLRLFSLFVSWYKLPLIVNQIR